MCLFVHCNIFTAFDHAISSSHWSFLKQFEHSVLQNATQNTNPYHDKLFHNNTHSKEHKTMSAKSSNLRSIHDPSLLSSPDAAGRWRHKQQLCANVLSSKRDKKPTHTHTSHHIKVVCSINSYALRSLPLNCTHKPQRDASHWNRTHNKKQTHKQKVNAHFSMNSTVPRQSHNKNTSFTRKHQIWRHGFILKTLPQKFTKKKKQ